MDLGGAFLGPIATQQKMEQSEAMAPLLRAHEAATTRLDIAQASNLEEKAKTEKLAGAAMAQALGSGGVGATGGTPSKMSTTLLGMAQIWSSSGSPAKAQEAMKEAVAAARVETDQEKNAETKALHAYTQKKAFLDMAGQRLQAVRGPEDWDKINSDIERTTGKASPWKDLPYDPFFIMTLQDSLTKSKDQADRARHDVEMASKLRSEAEKRRAGLVRDQLRDREVTIKEGKAGADKKVGGKDMGEPTTGARTQAASLIKLLPEAEGLDDETLKLAAYDVAAQARALRQKNPALTPDEALRQAVGDKRASGDFTRADATPPKKVAGVEVPLTGSKGKASYQPTSPLPESRAKLEVGKRYKDGSGQVGIWNGTGWDPVKKAKDE